MPITPADDCGSVSTLKAKSFVHKVSLLLASAAGCFRRPSVWYKLKLWPVAPKVLATNELSSRPSPSPDAMSESLRLKPLSTFIVLPSFSRTILLVTSHAPRSSVHWTAIVSVSSSPIGDNLPKAFWTAHRGHRPGHDNKPNVYESRDRLEAKYENHFIHSSNHKLLTWN